MTLRSPRPTTAQTVSPISLMIDWINISIELFRIHLSNDCYGAAALMKLVWAAETTG